jgi:hypothetical protein
LQWRIERLRSIVILVEKRVELHIESYLYTLLLSTQACIMYAGRIARQDSQAGRQAGRQVGRGGRAGQAGRQAGRQAGNF